MKKTILFCFLLLAGVKSSAQLIFDTDNGLGIAIYMVKDEDISKYKIKSATYSFKQYYDNEYRYIYHFNYDNMGNIVKRISLRQHNKQFDTILKKHIQLDTLNKQIIVVDTSYLINDCIRWYDPDNLFFQKKHILYDSLIGAFITKEVTEIKPIDGYILAVSERKQTTYLATYKVSCFSIKGEKVDEDQYSFMYNSDENGNKIEVKAEPRKLNWTHLEVIKKAHDVKYDKQGRVTTYTRGEFRFVLEYYKNGLEKIGRAHV